MSKHAVHEPPLLRPVALDRAWHLTDRLDCGHERLDRWLRQSAGQGERRDAIRTYVVAGPDRAVVGYVALVVGQIAMADATSEVAKGMSMRFPIPITTVARLAVDRSVQRTGVGTQLMRFAIRRCLVASDEVGSRAVVVDAMDERAAAFYERFGFEAVQAAPLRLMVPMVVLRSVS